MAVSYSLDSELNSPMQQIPGKSYSHFYFKSLIILFIIILLPFFPSQAPEFLNKTVLTTHWEILQLLFIGIVVSYGLFSTRRNVSMNIETYSNIDITQTYLSGISHVSSIFENEFENLSGCDEKRGIYNWNNHQYLHEESTGVFTNVSSVLYGYKNPVPCNAHHVFDELPKPNSKSSFGCKPLGLPIRSLKLRDIESDYPEVVNVSESSSRLKGFPKCVDKIDKDEIRGLDPTNLEEKFEETVVRSPIPWGSRSIKMQKTEELGIFKFNSSNSRPFSVGKFEPEPVKSQPFRLPKAPRLSFKDSKVSHKRSMDSSSILSSLSSVETKLPSPSFAPSKNDASPFVRLNIKEFSKVNAKRGFKDNFKDVSKNKIGDIVDSLNLDAKSNKFEAISKGKSRGKSVRTVRPSEAFLEAMKTEQVYPIRNEKMESVSPEKQNLDNFSCEPNPSFLKYRKGQRQVLADGTIVESERESESDFGNFEASSDEEKCDQESDSGEVDKKASEFIAKFKEQIRLQKVKLDL